MNKQYAPPHQISSDIVNLVSEISELLGRWSAKDQLKSPQLRKENRIRTIQASLAIEHNSLTIEQVSAIMDGKRVLGPPKEVQEVRNAIIAYEHLSKWKSTSIANLLNAHQLLMTGLVDIPGKLRSSNVGIFRNEQLIHMAPPASQIKRLIEQLLVWLKQTDIHPLISSCIFHYEFEFIHPFTDGNGRMGRLWQTLILSEWRSELAWLPVETLIKDKQEEYYEVLRQADTASDSTCFVIFMLHIIKSALQESIQSGALLSEEMAEELSEENQYRILNETARNILIVLKTNPHITIAQLAERLKVSTRTIERQLKLLQTRQLVERMGSTKAGYWRVIASHINSSDLSS